MRLRSTIVILVILLGLGAYVYWVEFPQAEEAAKKKTLFTFKTDEVTKVELVYADRDIVVERAGAEWRLKKPVDLAADATTVNNLIGAIADCEVKKDLAESPSDLAPYGLDKPLVTVTVTLKDRTLPAVVVGKTTPVGFSTYIQKQDDKKVLLTGSAFRSGMDKQVKDLRDKAILSFADADVQRLELHGPDRDLRIVGKGDTWTIEQPATYAADAGAVRNLLSTLRTMRATDFPADNPTDLSPYGLDAPRLKLTLYLGKDNAEKSLLIGKSTEKNELYVQGSGVPTVYTVGDWLWRDVNKTVNDFRDKTVLAFARDNVAAIDVKTANGESFKLVRGEGDKWRLDGSEEKPAATAISQFIGDLHGLKGFEIVADQPGDLAVYGMAEPVSLVTLRASDGNPIGAIRLGARPDANGKIQYTAMADGGPTVFLVRDYLATRLIKSAQDFVEHPKPTPIPGTPAALDSPDDGPADSLELPEPE